MNIEDKCNELRSNTLAIEREVRELRKQPMDALTVEAAGEMISNLMLAIRHLEDARMRLGKVIQAKNGGVSRYDKTPEAPEPPPPPPPKRILPGAY